MIDGSSRRRFLLPGGLRKPIADLIRDCRRRGHELGTHGWEHGSLEKDEDFRSASYDQQRAWIRLATEAVEKASGVRPVVFRAPSLWIGETTLRALEDEGYRYDSSVPARRFDCGFGRVHYLKYFRAPSEPYRLSSYHLSLPGYSSIIEMAPVSVSASHQHGDAPGARSAGDEVDGPPDLSAMLRGWCSIATPTNSCMPIGNPSRAICPNGICRVWARRTSPSLTRFVEHMMRQGYFFYVCLQTRLARRAVIL